MKFFKKPSVILSLTMLLGVAPQVYFETRDITPSHLRDIASRGQTAYELWAEMMENSVSFNAKATKVLGSGHRSISWGGEKEGSSSYASRLFGPSEEGFRDIVENMTDEERKEFLQDFFTGWLNPKTGSSYRVWVDSEGNKFDPSEELLDGAKRNKAMDISFLDGLDPSSASVEQLDEVFNTWISKTNDSPFSYLTPGTRQKFWKGKMPNMAYGTEDFYDMVPNIGKPQLYMEEIEDTSVGWEMKFKPQKTYGEFQEMIAWYKKVMGRNGELFQAPGHQRMVVPVGGRFSRTKAAELTKVAQSLIVLEGIAGGSGIETADYKSIISDEEFYESLVEGYETDRGPIRIDDESRFVSDSISIEFRSGTKNSRVSRFIQASMASRFARGEMADLKKWNEWQLIPDDYYRISADKLVEEFGLTSAKANKVAAKLNDAGLRGYNVVLWNWYGNNPMLSETKKAILRDLTKNYLEDVASLRQTNRDNLKKAVIALQKDWVHASNLREDIKSYMMPKRKFSNEQDFHKFKPSTNMRVDVNKVDLGIEYSAKFPLKFQGDYLMENNEHGGYSTVRTDDGKMAWLQSRVDMPVEEKEEYIKKLATDLRDRLGGEGEAIRIDEDGHGHGLDIAYKIKDAKDRSWRVEWDGIGRNYTPSGEVIIDSVRAGSIEVVTPKFEPNMDEMKAVFETFDKNSAMPYIKAGGGHINIDLSVFDGKPKEFARFLATFHEYRSVIAFMFQDMQRIKSAEPVDISDEFARQLANWDGSENELKKALYNEGYFNKRVGRKARYSHLDVSAYFQDVIPEQFISDDFDISNPQTPWRPAFRVESHIRKGEVRMMNAPRDAYESAIQMKLFRAILHKALNRSDEIEGTMQNMSHEDYLKNPTQLFSDLEKMTSDLGLEMNEYRPMAGEALSSAEIFTGTKFYRPLQDQLKINPKFHGWGQAVSPRPADAPINSSAREYTGPIYEEAKEFQRLRVESAEVAQNARETVNPNYLRTKRLTRNSNCVEAIRGLMSN